MVGQTSVEQVPSLQQLGIMMKHHSTNLVSVFACLSSSYHLPLKTRLKANSNVWIMHYCDAQGLQREPKWGHLRDVHKALNLCKKPLLWGTPGTQVMGKGLEVLWSFICIRYNAQVKARGWFFKTTKIIVNWSSCCILYRLAFMRSQELTFVLLSWPTMTQRMHKQ